MYSISHSSSSENLDSPGGMVSSQCSQHLAPQLTRSSSVYLKPCDLRFCRTAFSCRRPQSKKSTLSAENTRNLLVCFLWVVKNMDVRVLTSWWQELSSQRLKQLLSILQLAAANFEYKVSA